MTDVLIKNWCIPECCMDCDPDFAYAIKCKAYNENKDFTRQRAENCPLVEIKHSQDFDTISRADAIEALKECEKRLTLAKEAHGMGEVKYDEPIINAYDAYLTINALPSAEAEPTVIRSRTFMPTKDFEKWAERIREVNPNAIVIPCDSEVVSAEAEWIPCSERLPKELKAVNVTWVNHNPPVYYQNIKDVPKADTAVYYRGAWYWWDAEVIDLLGEYDGAYIHGIEPIDKDIEVTAWMPLPKPYEEASR